MWKTILMKKLSLVKVLSGQHTQSSMTSPLSMSKILGLIFFLTDDWLTLVQAFHWPIYSHTPMHTLVHIHTHSLHILVNSACYRILCWASYLTDPAALLLWGQPCGPIRPSSHIKHPCLIHHGSTHARCTHALWPLLQVQAAWSICLLPCEHPSQSSGLELGRWHSPS